VLHSPPIARPSANAWDLLEDSDAWKAHGEQRLAHDVQRCVSSGKRALGLLGPFPRQQESAGWFQSLFGSARAEAPAPVVFASFNKYEKLNPTTLTAWSQILRRRPHSVLWMLDPATAAGGNLTLSVAAKSHPLYKAIASEFQARGVSPSRVVLAPRCQKEAHLARLQHADLFLDSPAAYGAHSTATDALRAGLPVLGYRPLGSQMSERVAAAVLGAISPAMGALLTGLSLRDFVDLGVRLSPHAPRVRELVTRAVREALGPAGALHQTAYTADLERAQTLMWEVFAERNASHGAGFPMHVVV